MWPRRSRRSPSSDSQNEKERHKPTGIPDFSDPSVSIRIGRAFVCHLSDSVSPPDIPYRRFVPKFLTAAGEKEYFDPVRPKNAFDLPASPTIRLLKGVQSNNATLKVHRTR